MKPIDFRNATWAEVRGHVTEDMLRVHEAFKKHGPGTTRAVSIASGISLLTLRPRTTDLYQCCLIACTGREGREGVYEYRTEAQALEELLRRQVKERKAAPTVASNAGRVLAHRRHEKQLAAQTYATGQLSFC